MGFRLMSELQTPASHQGALLGDPEHVLVVSSSRSLVPLVACPEARESLWSWKELEAEHLLRREADRAEGFGRRVPFGKDIFFFCPGRYLSKKNV